MKSRTRTKTRLACAPLSGKLVSLALDLRDVTLDAVFITDGKSLNCRPMRRKQHRCDWCIQNKLAPLR